MHFRSDEPGAVYTTVVTSCGANAPAIQCLGQALSQAAVDPGDIAESCGEGRLIDYDGLRGETGGDPPVPRPSSPWISEDLSMRSEDPKATGEAPTAEQQIRDLARRHGVVFVRTPLDDWADQVSRLSDAEVELDDVENLIVALGRAKVLNGKELTRLHWLYLNERKAKPDHSYDAAEE